MAFLCVDIGGTNTILGAGNGEFETIAKCRTEDFIKDVSSAVTEALQDTDMRPEDINETAVAAAGPIDREKKVFYPPNITDEEGLKEIDLGKALEDFGDITIINDCASAVLGEYHYGGHDSDNIIYVTISSGIGAGAILNGRLIEGLDGNFAEVGHMKIENNLECGCSGEGHWEAYCSGNRLPHMAEKLFNAEYDDARQIFDKYDEGSEKAAEVVEEMQQINSRGVANIATMYNPEKIILGGAVALNHPETVVEPLEEKVEDLTVNQTPEIGLCRLGDEAVIHGLRAVCNGKHSSEK